jgi:hypothetical protein
MVINIVVTQDETDNDELVYWKMQRCYRFTMEYIQWRAHHILQGYHLI